MTVEFVDGPLSGESDEIDLTGPTHVDSTVTSSTRLATEIVKMDLSGTSLKFGSVKVTENPLVASTGVVEPVDPSDACFPSLSTYDVFVVIDFPTPGLLHNHDPVEMEAEINQVPPEEGVVYENPGDPIPLFLGPPHAGPPLASEDHVANIRHAEHVPVPTPPEPSASWAGVIVFDGTFSVGPAANGGPGLCLPGLDPQNGCAPASPGAFPVPDTTFTFGVPSAFSTPVVPDVPATCLVAGVADGNVVAPPGSQNPLVNCDFDVEGDLTGAASASTPAPNVTGPTCGATEGNGSGTTNFGNNGSHGVDFGWVTSAGGTLPVTGTLDDNGKDVQFVVLVQARALGAALPTTIPCVTTPATAFSFLAAGAIGG